MLEVLRPVRAAELPRPNLLSILLLLISRGVQSRLATSLHLLSMFSLALVYFVLVKRGEMESSSILEQDMALVLVITFDLVDY